MQQYFGERYLKFKQTNHICSPLKISQSITLNGARVVEMTKTRNSFMKARSYLALRCREKRVSQKKREKMVKTYFLKLLLIDFGCAVEQQDF